MVPYISNNYRSCHLCLLRKLLLSCHCMLFTDQSNLHLILSSACLEFYSLYLHICSSNFQQLCAPPEDFDISLSTAKKMTYKNIITLSLQWEHLFSHVSLREWATSMHDQMYYMSANTQSCMCINEGIKICKVKISYTVL